MFSRFIDHIESSGLIPPGVQVLVGYSGGPDSTALLHLLHEAGLRLVAGHLHHGQREEADDELARCRAFCEEIGVPFVSGKADVPALSKDLKVSLEEGGRLARYEFLSSAAKETGCHVIATGHTRDDQIETVLLHIARGAGLAGLAGIPERRENIVRPLLPFRRSETRSYCEALRLWTHDDPGNRDIRHSRSRIRTTIVPEFERINPGFAKSVLRLSDIAKEENEFLNGMAAAALEKAELSPNRHLSFMTEDCELTLDRELIIHLPAVLLRRALKLAAAALGGTLDHNQTLTSEEGLRSGGSGSVTSTEGAVIIQWHERCISLVASTMDKPFRSNLTISGETVCDEFNWAISALAKSTPLKDAERTGLECEIDLDRTKGNLYFRNWKPGDRLQPIGFTGHRKVADLMSESGLTTAARRRLPLVCDMIGPIWIPGVSLDERAKPGEECSNILRLRFGPARKGGDDRNGNPARSVLG